jgi:hypothetical protein
MFNIDNETIELEEYAKSGKTPPKGKNYKFKVDKDSYTTDKEILTGEEILIIANKLPIDSYRLDMKLTGGMTKKINLTDDVSLVEAGVERFITIKIDPTEG